MSAKEREMAELLARPDRDERFSSLIAHIDSDVSTILDLGCGIGALTIRLAKRFPFALIVGIDRSKYLLNRLQRSENVLSVLGEIPELPLKNGFFDLVVIVQVLHEILHFKGSNALSKTLRNVFDLLKNNGELIILDHANPRNMPVSLVFSKELLEKLCEFQSKFKPRGITYHDLGEGRIRMNARDFYDFVTKIWALNSDLEEEEMNETHTPFTCEELANSVQEAGFRVTCTTSMTSIDRYLGYYNIILEAKVELPNRYMILQAIKTGQK
jgi:SAM-dependent methyltransferase